jgi:hypothetical protein
VSEILLHTQNEKQNIDSSMHTCSMPIVCLRYWKLIILILARNPISYRYF